MSPTQEVCDFEKQQKTTMSQIDYAITHAKSLKCNYARQWQKEYSN